MIACVTPRARTRHGVPRGDQGGRYRAESVAAELHVDFAGIGSKEPISRSRVKGVEEKPPDASSGASDKLLLEWESATMPRWFPLMQGELPVSADHDRNPTGFPRVATNRRSAPWARP